MPSFLPVLSYSSLPQDENASSLNSGVQEILEGGGDGGAPSAENVENKTSSTPTTSNRVEISSKKEGGPKKGGKKSGKKKKTSSGDRSSRANKDASIKSEGASRNQLDQEKVDKLVTKAKAHAQALQAVRKAVFELQLLLLDGVKTTAQLTSAFELLTQSEYRDVVVERSIYKRCGYPVCTKTLGPEQRKGRYKLSLSERKVYDAREMALFCSQTCQATSKNFALCCLLPEREELIPQEKLVAILHAVRDPKSNKDTKLPSKEGGLNSAGQQSKRDIHSLLTKVKEREGTEAAPESSEDFGPSGSIEGYTPVSSIRDWRLLKEARQQQASASGSPESTSLDVAKPSEDGKPSPTEARFVYGSSVEKGRQALNDAGSVQDLPVLKSILKKKKSDSERTVKRSVSWGDQQTRGDRVERVEVKLKSKAPSKPKRQVKELPQTPKKSFAATSTSKERLRDKAESSSDAGNDKEDIVQSVERLSIREGPGSGSTGSSSSLAADVNSNLQSVPVSPSEGHANATSSESRCQDQVIESDVRADSENPVTAAEARVAERLASAQDMAAALMEASKATAAGDLESSEAVAMVGLSILSDNERREISPNGDMEVDEPVRVGGKWPEIEAEEDGDAEVSSSKGGWHDTAPKNFKLEISMFGTIWMSLEEWISAATVAFIYGREAQPEEDFLYINGREYRMQVACEDGVSAEISRTFSNCLARVLPDVIKALGINVPLSNIEKALGRMVRTMSFVEPLPAFGVNQWRMLVMLFLEGLAVDQVEPMGAYLSKHSTLFRNLLKSTGTSEGEYETFRGLLLPSGRLLPASTLS